MSIKHQRINCIMFSYAWCSDICSLADQEETLLPSASQGPVGAFTWKSTNPEPTSLTISSKFQYIRPILPHALNRRRARYQTTRDSPLHQALPILFRWANCKLFTTTCLAFSWKPQYRLWPKVSHCSSCLLIKPVLPHVALHSTCLVPISWETLVIKIFFQWHGYSMSPVTFINESPMGTKWDKKLNVF